MDHLIGGYFLVEGRVHPPWATLPHLPDRFWSISGCIAGLHPHIHLLAWTHKTPEAEPGLWLPWLVFEIPLVGG